MVADSASKMVSFAIDDGGLALVQEGDESVYLEVGGHYDEEDHK